MRNPFPWMEPRYQPPRRDYTAALTRLRERERARRAKWQEALEAIGFFGGLFLAASIVTSRLPLYVGVAVVALGLPIGGGFVGRAVAHYLQRQR